VLASCLGRVFVRFCWEIWQQVPEWKKALARGDWTAIEEGILNLARLMATEIMAGCLVWYLEQEDTRLLGKKLAEGKGIKTQGTRNVHVTLATGRRLQVHTTYALPQRSTKRDYRRWPGSRRPGIKGCYPVLERLGFVHNRSLLYCKMVAQAAVLCTSFRPSGLAPSGGSRATGVM